MFDNIFHSELFSNTFNTITAAICNTGDITYLITFKCGGSVECKTFEHEG